MERNELEKRISAYLSAETDASFRREVEDLRVAGKWDELSERFYRDLEFGTGGIRGILGGGFNRMNTLVVAKSTQGLATYLKKTGREGKAQAVIAYDSRRYSDVFARTAAEVLCGNGIRVHLFSGLRPTPELSFAVRQVKADIGIVVTASHNPKVYNGYKVYWSDGGQVVPPHDDGIIDEVQKPDAIIARMAYDEALASGMLRIIDEEIDNPYIRMVTSHCLRPDMVVRLASKFKAVYTPLHGAGRKSVEDTFHKLGIRLLTVPEQREPDGDFPTVTYPNPEEASALNLAVTLAKKEGANLVLGTDPDSDRLGIAVPGPDGKDWVLLNGNQTGSLMADYIFSTLKEQGRLPERPVLIKTIVTTDLQRMIGEHYGAKVVDVLTGFKYIAEKIREFETTGEHYVFGGEESYGYLVGTEVRDKDAVSAAAVAAEMALYCMDRGIGVLEYLEDLYKRFGYYEEILVSKNFPGREGMVVMNRFMSGLREKPPSTLAGLPVVLLRDYHKRTALRLPERTASAIDLPQSDVLQFTLSDETLISVRPSGTEPKLKFYASVRVPVSNALSDAKASAAAKLTSIRSCIEDMVDEVNRPEKG